MVTLHPAFGVEVGCRIDSSLPTRLARADMYQRRFSSNGSGFLLVVMDFYTYPNFTSLIHSAAWDRLSIGDI